MKEKKGGNEGVGGSFAIRLQLFESFWWLLENHNQPTIYDYVNGNKHMHTHTYTLR